MRKTRLKIVLTIVIALLISFLLIQIIARKAEIKKCHKQITLMTKTAELMKKNINNLETERSNLLLEIKTVKKELRRVDSAYSAESALYQSALKKNATTQARLDSIETELSQYKTQYSEALKNIEQIQTTLKMVSARADSLAVIKPESIDPKLKTRQAIRCAALVADKFDPSCEEVFRKLQPYLPKISDAENQQIYSKTGESLRAIANKHHLTPETYFLFAKSFDNINPFQLCYVQSKEAFRTMLRSGDFAYWSRFVFNADSTDVEQCKYIFKQLYNNFE